MYDLCVIGMYSATDKTLSIKKVPNRNADARFDLFVLLLSGSETCTD